MRVITCTSEEGLTIRFGMNYAPWLLTEVEGLYVVKSNVYTSDNTMTDGSTYQGSTLEERNIVLTMEDQTHNHKHNRQLLYDVFKTDSFGTLTYTEEGENRVIDYVVENIEIEGSGRQIATIELKCPDPNFSSDAETSVVIAGWQKAFEFPFEIPVGGIEFGTKTDERLKDIRNDSGADDIGMTVIIEALGNITNPSITKVETQESFCLGDANHEFHMIAGDVVTLTTHKNNKHVYLTHNGQTEEVNMYQTEDSEFIQLMRGSNTIGYNAEEGIEYMNVTVKFKYKYVGV